VYFLASNFDRLYLADAVSFAALGVYGIARTFADTAMNLTSYLASNILFPKVSTSALRGAELRAAILPSRRAVVWLIAGGMAVGIVFADLFILLAYDVRYQAAAFYLPVLLAGGWFAMLASFSESILMGIGKPSNVAFGSGAKFLAILLIVPFVLPRYGMAAAVTAFSGVEIIRYVVLAFRQQAHGLSFWRQDIATTSAFIVTAVLLREITGLLGVTTGVAGWVAMMKQVFNI
jgi:O-antigen/teichoic acid export membrane protein